MLKGTAPEVATKALSESRDLLDVKGLTFSR